jgi:hypothetical protein
MLEDVADWQRRVGNLHQREILEKKFPLQMTRLFTTIFALTEPILSLDSQDSPLFGELGHMSCTAQQTSVQFCTRGRTSVVATASKR